MVPRMTELAIRDARDTDSAQILALLEAVYSEYENCFLVLDEVPELIKPATSFAAMSGRFWVGEREGVVRAMVACAPSHAPGLFELKKLYVAKEERGLGLGKRLIAIVEDEARRRGATRVHLWSDTRFLTAHQVYARAGYTKLPETRDLNDVSASVEFHFEKSL
jgi:putative acetyltransferase